jgi:hypothetical protein
MNKVWQSSEDSMTKFSSKKGGLSNVLLFLMKSNALVRAYPLAPERATTTGIRVVIAPAFGRSGLRFWASITYVGRGR